MKIVSDPAVWLRITLDHQTARQSLRQPIIPLYHIEDCWFKSLILVPFRFFWHPWHPWGCVHIDLNKNSVQSAAVWLRITLKRIHIRCCYICSSFLIFSILSFKERPEFLVTDISCVNFNLLHILPTKYFALLVNFFSVMSSKVLSFFPWAKKTWACQSTKGVFWQSIWKFLTFGFW